MTEHAVNRGYALCNLLAGLLLLPMLSLPAYGDQGDPLAIRTWPQGVVSLETHWDFEVVINLQPGRKAPAELAASDLFISRSSDALAELRFQWQATKDDGLDGSDQVPEMQESHWPIADLSLYFDRVPNSSEQTLLASDQATFVSKNALSISHIEGRLLILTVDGVRVALPLTERFAEEEDQLPIDVLVLAPLSDATDQQIPADALAQAQILKPRWGVLVTSPPPSNSAAAVHMVGNSWAVSCTAAAADTESLQTGDELPATQWVQLQTTPWKMPAELSDLFEKKERACQESQRVFSQLSAAQMNFKPANGTHTPRWNSEHMLGRELLFFSQIYAQRSPELKIIDLNPKQMPPDYEPRNPEWDGREEARQMERISRYTRRFAYLLDGLPLDEPAPGSTWTIRKLLKQMEEHYSEHTANVVKKFELPDWPHQ